jgi:TonB family protein
MIMRAALCLLLVLVPTTFLSSSAWGQLSALDKGGERTAKKLKALKPHKVVVAHFTDADGASSTQTDYLGAFLASSIKYHANGLYLIEPAVFDKSLAEHSLKVHDISDPGDLEELGAILHFDYIVIGIVEKSSDNYNLRLTVRHVSDGSVQFSENTPLQRTEFLDSFVEQFPRPVDSSQDSMPYGAKSEGVSPPSCVYCPDPHYSSLARELKIQGTAVFDVVISAEGQTVQIHPHKLIGYALDEEAFNVIKTWKFKAARKNGAPVSVVLPIEVTFRLF